MFKYCVLLMLFAVCGVQCNVTSACSQKEICSSYLDVAMEMIAKAKYNIPTCTSCPKNHLQEAMDCSDVLQMGHNTSGIYEIWPVSRIKEGKSLLVYCDMDTNSGGWTVIQRRGDFQTPKEYFYQDWESYKEGFGDIEKDFWLGNDNIFALTNQKLYSVRFDLKDFEQNKRYAHYDKFWIDDEYQKYTLHISVYSGDAGEAMGYHNNQKFTTKDQDNDSKHGENCAVIHKSGWWHSRCQNANLNGLYHKGKHSSHDGISWNPWKGHEESMDWTEIKIRPKHFGLSMSSEEYSRNKAFNGRSV